MKTRNVCALFLTVLSGIAFSVAAAKSQFMVITWGGNSPEWNQILHLSGVRIGCSDASASCLKEVDQIAASQHVSSVFLAIALNPSRVASDAATYGSVAGTHPSLVEVGFDDFVSQAQKTNLDPAALSSLLESVASNLKARNSKLQMGITLYQDQLDSGQLDRLQLSDSARRSVDYVHLFPHYRKERKPVSEYIARAKQVFPNAKVMLGVYAYDRREYLPCAIGDQARCSSEEEVNLFDQNLRGDLQIASSGEAAGIEFFPGNFGDEDAWKGWNNPRACKQGEKGVCVQNTVAMRAKIRDEMRSAGQ